ncbi:zinc finger protein swm-like isoform 2-T4 [Glossina fuscipes fuscipes]
MVTLANKTLNMLMLYYPLFVHPSALIARAFVSNGAADYVRNAAGVGFRAAAPFPFNLAKSSHYMAASRNTARARNSYPEGSTRVDRRPKNIVVTGFNSEEADFVLGHFKHFGETTKHDMDLEKPQLILSYATRINAEQAILRGKLFKDKHLQIVFAPVVQKNK